MPNEALKPCPFCGETDIRCYPGTAGAAWVKCLGCRLEYSTQNSREEAIAAWNKRVAEQEREA